MIRYLFSLLLLLLVVSCTTEIDQQFNGQRSLASGSKAVFRASTEVPGSPETKVFADENLKVLWNADDRISVFNMTTYNYQYVFTGDDGDTAGGFEEIPVSGLITAADINYIYADYPYSKSTKMDNEGKLTMMLPAEQVYKEKSFGIGANTMVAVTDGNFLAFKNVGGYLSIRLYGDNVNVKSVTIKGNNGERIAGKAFITMPLGGTPSIGMDETATDAIILVCEPAVKLGSSADAYTDFWFVIPPVTFEKGFTITVVDDKGGVFEKSTSKSFTVSRNTLDWMNALKVVPSYSGTLINDEIPRFSESIELMCLIWKLMGATEYNTCNVSQVNESAESFFASMKNHQAIQLARSYYNSGISYDAVTAYGLHLVIDEHGVISFNPDIVDGCDPSFERWSTQQKNEMLVAINDFYKQSNYHEWYLSLENLRQQAIESFKKVCDVDYSWFESFFGSSDNISTQIVLSFLIGSNNNGLSVDLTNGRRLLSPVMGSIVQDNAGNPKYLDVLDIIIHEFCHPYCNPLISSYWNQINEMAALVYEKVEGDMVNLAYGSPQTMMNETFVRSCVIRYLMSHREVSQSALIQIQESLGFLLVKTFVEVLETRELQQDQYATMDDFMPVIIEAINGFDLSELEQITGQYDEYTQPSTPNLLPGVFSVGEQKRIRFTKGNLFWDGAKWGFEPNQMNFTNEWDPTHIGLFYWTTTAAASYAIGYSWNGNATSDRFFCDGSDSAHMLTVEGISGLRVLSDESDGEVTYLLRDRVNAQNLYKYPVEIKGVGGCLILAPDDYKGSIAVSYDAASWAIAETEGLVCFAPNNYRHGTDIISGSGGCYWCGNSHVDSANHAHILSFSNTIYHNPSYSSRNNGFCIRLIKDVTE